MNETRTAAILQRMPAILAVTASSYGLALPPGEARKPQAAGPHRGAHGKGCDKPAAAQR